MSARDRFKYDVQCPTCGQVGVFHASEEDHPYITNPGRSIDEIEGKFSATVKDGVEVTALCGLCKTSFPA